MEIIAASLSLETPYPKTVQSLDIAAASLSVVNISSRGSFISMSLELPYARTTHSLDIAAASLSVVSISSRGSFISMSLIASKGYVQVIDLIKGVTVTNS